MTRYEEYFAIVAQIEATQGLVPFAKKSFEDESIVFIDGDSVREYYERILRDGRGPVESRTPLQRERDRIVHSRYLRKLSEKYHVVYYAEQKITRNHITHVMRMAQVARSIARGLGLNQDFAEAVALGSKVGMMPFHHVAKDVIPGWIEQKVMEIAKPTTGSRFNQQELGTADYHARAGYPRQVTQLPTSQRDELLRAIPLAQLTNARDPFYSSGKQSYWLLTTQPYFRARSDSKWYAETAYGIWRHSLTTSDRSMTPDTSFRFDYRYQLDTGTHTLSWAHDSYEAMVVRLADDITWVLENLQDANDARILAAGAKGKDLFEDIYAEQRSSDARDSLWGHDFLQSLADKNLGRMYSYFIEECVRETRNIFDAPRNKDLLIQRQALRKGDADAPIVALPEKALVTLKGLKDVLFGRVFGDARTRNRNTVLRTILEFVAEHLFGRLDENLPKSTQTWIRERLAAESQTQVDQLLRSANTDKFLRLQIVVNIMSELSDRDVFNMVGMGDI